MKMTVLWDSPDVSEVLTASINVPEESDSIYFNLMRKQLSRKTAHVSQSARGLNTSNIEHSLECSDLLQTN
jgi:hypothetical protein